MDSPSVLLPTLSVEQILFGVKPQIPGFMTQSSDLIPNLTAALPADRDDKR
jgi:hypothetical protein